MTPSMLQLLGSVAGEDGSGLGEDGVGPDATPNDVGCARDDWISVLERRPAVGGPGHLEDPGRTLDTLDS